MLARYGMSLRRSRLDDENRTLLDSITHGIDSHARVSRKLAGALDELEELLN